MKVLIYSKTFLPALGGLERNTLTLYQTLKRLNLNLHIVTETIEKFNGEENVKRTSKIKDFIALLKAHDLLIINGGIAMRILIPCLLLRKKYIIIYQNATLYNQNSNIGFKAKMENYFRKFLAKQALANICLTEFSKTQLNIKNKNSYVLYNPIDSKLEQINHQIQLDKIEKSIDCLFVGRIIKGKGIFILLEALIILQKKGLNLNCTFAGNGKDIYELKEASLKTNLSINFAGKIDGFTLIKMYKQSKILVLPSSTHIEGNPLVIAEAISCGLPVIASNQPSIIESVDNCGLIFQSGNALDLAAKIEKMIAPDFYKIIQKNTTEHKKKFSMHTYQKKWTSILDALSIIHEN